MSIPPSQPHGVDDDHVAVLKLDPDNLQRNTSVDAACSDYVGHNSGVKDAARPYRAPLTYVELSWGVLCGIYNPGAHIRSMAPDLAMASSV